MPADEVKMLQLRSFFAEEDDDGVVANVVLLVILLLLTELFEIALADEIDCSDVLIVEVDDCTEHGRCGGERTPLGAAISDAYYNRFIVVLLVILLLLTELFEIALADEIDCSDVLIVEVDDCTEHGRCGGERTPLGAAISDAYYNRFT
ncbi:unnamed protein product [Gongylonema pulchrum]|uniref:Secreted protein n=1 Tax=Gongylonema pulchrum TaxID=637853 RepID=A0A183DP05_9BILA|nr:unnamed protein product [Gongylonema pulchrum]